MKQNPVLINFFLLSLLVALCNQRTFYEDKLQLSQALLSHKDFKIHYLKIVSVNYKRKYLEGRNWC